MRLNQRVLLLAIYPLMGLLLSLVPVSAQQTTITTGETEIRTRLGPGYTYPRVEILPPESPIALLGFSPDEAWIQVEYFGLNLWIEHSQLELPENLELPEISDFPPEPDLPYEQCI